MEEEKYEENSQNEDGNESDDLRPASSTKKDTKPKKVLNEKQKETVRRNLEIGRKKRAENIEKKKIEKVEAKKNPRDSNQAPEQSPYSLANQIMDEINRKEKKHVIYDDETEEELPVKKNKKTNSELLEYKIDELSKKMEEIHRNQNEILKMKQIKQAQKDVKNRNKLIGEIEKKSGIERYRELVNSIKI